MSGISARLVAVAPHAIGAVGSHGNAFLTVTGYFEVRRYTHFARQGNYILVAAELIGYLFDLADNGLSRKLIKRQRSRRKRADSVVGIFGVFGCRLEQRRIKRRIENVFDLSLERRVIVDAPTGITAVIVFRRFVRLALVNGKTSVAVNAEIVAFEYKSGARRAYDIAPVVAVLITVK